jgi:hypothetical protein
MVFVSLFSIVSLFHGRMSSETAVESILNVLTYPLLISIAAQQNTTL